MTYFCSQMFWKCFFLSFALILVKSPRWADSHRHYYHQGYQSNRSLLPFFCLWTLFAQGSFWSQLRNWLLNNRILISIYKVLANREVRCLEYWMRVRKWNVRDLPKNLVFTASMILAFIFAFCCFVCPWGPLAACPFDWAWLAFILLFKAAYPPRWPPDRESGLIIFKFINWLA